LLPKFNKMFERGLLINGVQQLLRHLQRRTYKFWSWDRRRRSRHDCTTNRHVEK
jgi:hypothetical protein